MSMMQIGLSGTLAAQAGLNMTARNTANLSTSGYTRQGVLLTSRVGGGVDVTSLIRFADNYKTQQKWTSRSPHGEYNVAASYYGQLEQVMGLDEGTIKSSMTKFFGALDEVSSDVTNSALRQQVITAADGLAKSFNNLQHMLRTQFDTVRQESLATADQINALAGSVAELNQQIVKASANGTAPSELLDRRDEAIDQLSALIGVRSVRQADGTIDLDLANGLPLVSGGHVGKVSIDTSQGDKLALSLEFAGSKYPLEGAKVGGAMSGLFNFAEQTLLPQIEAIKTLAGEIAEQFNAQLTAGYGTNGAPGKPLFDFNPVSGELTLQPVLPEELGFSANPDESGNNDNLLKLIELRMAKIDIPGLGEVALGDAYTMLVGKVGSQSQQNQSMLAMAAEVSQQAEDSWLSVSGVNMEEEALNMSQFLQVYSANMKVISVANDLFTTTINSF